MGDYCGECEEPMILIERANGESFLSCQQCGDTRTNDQPEFVNTDEFGCSSYTFSGEGARPQGYKYEKQRISQARLRGKGSIQLLCQNFSMSTSVQKEMQSLLEKVKCRNLDAASGACFLSVVRRQQAREGRDDTITLRQVSSIIGVSVPKIAASLKYVESLLGKDEQPSNGAITNVCGIVRSVLPQFELQDPFVTGRNITQRVLKLTERIIQLVQRRTAKSGDPNYITIAAGFLAWQSCFFYQKAHHGQIPLESLKSPAKMSTLDEYLVMVRLTVSGTLVQAVRRSYSFIISEMWPLLEKMPWLNAKSQKKPIKTMVPQYLEQILECQGLTCEVLNTEEETKRQTEPIVPPVIPRELTTEEEAVLDMPELSEKDLPEEELSGYLRSAKEVDSLKRWMDSSDSEHN